MLIMLTTTQVRAEVTELTVARAAKRLHVSPGSIRAEWKLDPDGRLLFEMAVGGPSQVGQGLLAAETQAILESVWRREMALILRERLLGVLQCRERVSQAARTYQRSARP